MTHSLCVCSAHQNVVLLVDVYGLGLEIKRPDQIDFVFPLVFLLKFVLQSLLYHHHSQEYFFNWKITSSPYLEMLLIIITKLLF